MTPERPESREERAAQRARRRARLEQLGAKEVKAPRQPPGEQRTLITFFFRRSPGAGDTAQPSGPDDNPEAGEGHHSSAPAENRGQENP